MESKQTRSGMGARRGTGTKTGSAKKCSRNIKLQEKQLSLIARGKASYKRNGYTEGFNRKTDGLLLGMTSSACCASER